MNAIVVYVFLALSSAFGSYAGVHQTMEDCLADRARILEVLKSRADEAGAVHVDACREISLRPSLKDSARQEAPEAPREYEPQAPRRPA